MLEHCRLLLQHLSLPETAKTELQTAAEQFFTVGFDALKKINTDYYEGCITLAQADESIVQVAKPLQLDPAITAFILRASLSKTMREKYAQAGHPDELFWETIEDMQYKLLEHKQRKNIYGLEQSNWYDLFFKLKLFKLGRLEYERYTYSSEDVTVDDITVHKGDTVYFIHIPFSGPLTRETRMDSYRRAYKFFEKERNGKPLICYCESWLLSPKFREVLPSHLNMVDFVDDWKIYNVGTDHGANLWRVFGVPYTGDASVLPRDNTLRRALGDWLDNGGMTEYGYGLMAFDGEKIITHTGKQALWDHYQLLLERLPLPQEVTNELHCAGERFFEVGAADLLRLEVAYYTGKLDIAQASEEAHKFAETLNLSPLVINYIVCACFSKTMWEKFRNAGYSDELYWETVEDFQYKLFECKQVHGVYGLDCVLWYDIFFKVCLFKLGRLQFEKRLYYLDEPAIIGGMTVQKGDPIISVHIPSCGPLTRELRMDSYRRAYEFFKKENDGKPIVFYCGSWLCSTDNRDIFPAHLNVVDFLNDWKVFKERNNNGSDLWRVFGTQYTGDLSLLPRDNTMRRAFGEWLDNGGVPKTGYGIMLFDGKTMITE